MTADRFLWGSTGAMGGRRWNSPEATGRRQDGKSPPRMSPVGVIVVLPCSSELEVGARDLAKEKVLQEGWDVVFSDRGTVTGQKLTKGRPGDHLLTLRGRAITWQWRIDHFRRPGGEKRGLRKKKGSPTCGDPQPVEGLALSAKLVRGRPPM